MGLRQQPWRCHGDIMRRWLENDGKMMEDDGRMMEGWFKTEGWWKMMGRIWPLIIPSTMDLSNKWPFQTKHLYDIFLPYLPVETTNHPLFIDIYLKPLKSNISIFSIDLFTLSNHPNKTTEVSTACWAPTSAARPPWCAPSPTSSWRASPSATSWSLSSWSTRSRTRRSHHGATGATGHGVTGWWVVGGFKAGNLGG